MPLILFFREKEEEEKGAASVRMSTSGVEQQVFPSDGKEVRMQARMQVPKECSPPSTFT